MLNTFFKMFIEFSDDSRRHLRVRRKSEEQGKGSY